MALILAFEKVVGSGQSLRHLGRGSNFYEVVAGEGDSASVFLNNSIPETGIPS